LLNTIHTGLHVCYELGTWVLTGDPRNLKLYRHVVGHVDASNRKSLCVKTKAKAFQIFIFKKQNQKPNLFKTAPKA
jgi:hypothetical protein